MSNIDLPTSVILPREDFMELQIAAWDSTPPSVKDRALNSAQTTLVFAVMSGAVVAGCWGWAKATDWLEEKNFRRRQAEKQFNIDNGITIR